MTATLPNPSPDTYQEWAQDLIAQLDAQGATVPDTSTTEGDISAWEQAEEPVGSFMMWDNPLNTTLGGYGGTPQNSAGVQDYPSVAAGVEANAQTIIGTPAFQPILSALESGGGGDFGAVVGSSGWGSSGSLIDQILGEGGASTESGPAGAAGTAGTGTAGTGTAGATEASLNWNPFDLFGIPQTVTGSASAAIWSEVGPFLTKAILVVAGATLIILGVYKAAAPTIKPAIKDVAETGAAGAAVAA